MVAAYKWEFRARFRRHSFGWKSQPAVKRVKEALSEIKKVAKKDKLLAAEGSVLLLEKLSPALEHVDSSSGSIGTAVNNTIAALVPIIAAAPADEKTRLVWLERLFQAHADDEIPYIESLAEFWGELCATREVASHWADELLPTTQNALSRDNDIRGFFHGTSACLSSLYSAGRHDELLELLAQETFWHYRCWAVKALAAKDMNREALDMAESSRDAWASDLDIDQLCEKILMSIDLEEEAYSRYGLRANRSSTYTAWYRAVARKYPDKKPTDILHDLVNETPGEEGKWFAAAKDAKLFAEAITLARRTPCSPLTLTRAARDFALTQPQFATEAGMTALHWLMEGHGYDITSADVLNAYTLTMSAAANSGHSEQVRSWIEELVAQKSRTEHFVSKVLSRQLSQT
jgi:hypothetical protein